jgi:hypothetical protein
MAREQIHAHIDETRQSKPEITEVFPFARPLEHWPVAILTSKIYIMSDNKKQERDFTSEVDAILPQTTNLAKVRGPFKYILSYIDFHSPENFKMPLTSFLFSKNKHETYAQFIPVR